MSWKERGRGVYRPEGRSEVDRDAAELEAQATFAGDRTRVLRDQAVVIFFAADAGVGLIHVVLAGVAGRELQRAAAGSATGRARRQAARVGVARRVLVRIAGLRFAAVRQGHTHATY